MRNSLLLIGLSLSILSCSQPEIQLECGQVSSAIQDRIKQDVYRLSSDSLEGREAGEPGAEKAAAFIAQRFEQLGLKPAGDNGTYLQEFSFADKVESEISLLLDGKEFLASKDLYAVQFSTNASAENLVPINVGFGIVAPEFKWNDYAKLENKKLKPAAFIMDLSSPDGIHPHSKYMDYHSLEDRIKLAQTMGAKAVILVNREGMASYPSSNFKNLRNEGIKIPVVVASGSIDSLLNTAENISLSVKVELKEGKTQNVVAMVDNGAPYTVVMGAHYDHLGYGDAGSLYRGSEPQIHNGADDNASGTAGIMELAKYYASDPADKVNYLFIAFSAEEKGLLGSNYFVKNSPIPLENYTYMINMDMIGRLDSGRLIVNGVGTAPRFAKLDSLACGLNLTLNESGTGPSDHTSFYLQNVPVLSLFTGAHSDYHKPTDDADKVNYGGIEQVLNFVVHLNKAFADGGKAGFVKTMDEEERTSARWTVGLGVVPDYAFNGKGMRIDGVTEDKVAAKAGMKSGDVVVKMNDFEVVGMNSYMEALSKFKKGDSCTVLVKRKGNPISFEIVF